MPELVFDIQNITYRYNSDLTALNGVSLSIARGTRVAIMGANGSGKSTLLRILDGLYFPEQGAITVFGQPLTEEQLLDEAFAFDFRRRVALVFQNPDVQLFNPTVFDEVAFGPLQLRWRKDDIRRRVAEMLDILEISHLKDRSPHRLSGGEKKRVALASVLVMDPEVLLLDEPTVYLDLKHQIHFYDIVERLSVEQGMTIVSVTHDVNLAARYARRMMTMKAGLIAADGAPESVLTPEHLHEIFEVSVAVHKRSDGRGSYIIPAQ